MCLSFSTAPARSLLSSSNRYSRENHSAVCTVQHTQRISVTDRAAPSSRLGAPRVPSIARPTVRVRVAAHSVMLSFRSGPRQTSLALGKEEREEGRGHSHFSSTALSSGANSFSSAECNTRPGTLSSGLDSWLAATSFAYPKKGERETREHVSRERARAKASPKCSRVQLDRATPFVSRG